MQSTLSILQHGVYDVAMNERSFGKMVRRAREERGINQRDFALLIDVDPSTMSRIERDKQTYLLAVETFQKLLKELKLSETESLQALGYLTDAEHEAPDMDYQALRISIMRTILGLDDDQLESVKVALIPLKRGHPIRSQRRATPQPSNAK